jgi:hypothetical protein
MDGSSQEGVAVRRTYDSTATDPSLAVLEALADIKNKQLEDLAAPNQPTLHDEVDVDALDQLLTDDPDLTVSFQVEQYRVRVTGHELTIFLE